MQVAMSSPILSTRKKGEQKGGDPVPSRVEDRIDVRAAFPGIEAVVSICGAASNAGKTWLCETILRGLRSEERRSCALKVTRTHLGNCPRGIETCGTCDSLAGDFELVLDRERLDVPRKDTGRYYAAGADAVSWLLVKPASMKAGVLAALAEVPAGFVLVAEGNSFRDYATADVTLMASSATGDVKASAGYVLDRIDALVRNRTRNDHAALPARSGGIDRAVPVIAPAEAWAFVRSRIGPGIRP
jgi:molybdopterin-guanine dinucleotide biosynthesis protein